MKPGRNSKKIVFISFSFVLIACTFLAFTYNNVFSFDLKKIPFNGIKNAETKNPNKDKIVMTIDNTAITKEMYELTKNDLIYVAKNNNLPDQNITDQDVIDQLTEITCLYNEAIRRGLSVSYEEAYSYAQYVKQGAADKLSGKAEASPEEIQMLKDTIESSGYTFDEYFDKAAIPGYERLLPIGKLREQVYSDIQKEFSKKLTYNKISDKQEQAFDSLTSELKAKAEIKILEAPR